MKNSKKLDVLFLAFLIEIFAIITLLFTNLKNPDIRNYLILGVSFFAIVISFYSTVVISLITSLVFDFIYGSIILYYSVFLKSQYLSNFNNYIWIVLVPVMCFTSGKLGEIVEKIQQENKQLIENIKNSASNDFITYLGTKNSFYKDFKIEIAKSKRQNIKFSVILIKIQFFSELKAMYSEDSINSIKRNISLIMQASTRIEDKLYTLEEDTFSAILPFTDGDGAEIVKERIRKEAALIKIEQPNGEENVRLNFKMAVKEYDYSIDDPMNFIELMKKELEYDV